MERVHAVLRSVLWSELDRARVSGSSPPLSESAIHRHMRRYPPLSRGRRTNDRCGERGSPKRSFSINGMSDGSVPRKRFVIKMTGMAERAADTVRKPRADAVRNRERVLEAAKAVFSAGGPEASLEAVAKTGWCRHRYALPPLPDARGSVRSSLSSRGAAARRTGRTVEERAAPGRCAAPLAAIQCRVRRHQEGHVRRAGARRSRLVGTLGLFVRSPDQSRRRLARSRDRGRRDTRRDISPEDLLRALVGMCYMHDQPGWQKSVMRLVDVFVDGLRVRTKADRGPKLSSRGAASGRPGNRPRDTAKSRR